MMIVIYQWFFLTCLWIGLSCSEQYYDQTSCSSDTNNPGTRYTCSSSRNPCRTFFVYRANGQFRTISSISKLFGIDSDSLVSINNNVSFSSQVLETGHEVLVPILCSCKGRFSQANITYTVTQNVTFPGIACGVFEGLIKSITLAEENLSPGDKVFAGSVLVVPLKCACPDDDGMKYLVSYPFVQGDDTKKVSEKFNVSVEEIWEVNHMDPTPTVYPETTILIPLKDEPFISFSIDSDPPTPQFLPTSPVKKKPKISQLKKLYIAGSVIGFCLIVALLLACGLYIKALMKSKVQTFHSSSQRISSCSTPRSYQFSGPPTRSSTNSCLSPDLLAGIKYSLCMYTMEELKKATKNFSQDTKISNSVYKGMIENGEVIIKEMRFEGTRRVIDVHSKINHVNIVKLDGVCYGEDGYSLSYLVYEFPFNGSLRDCLSGSSAALHWLRRTQIAFDVATGLHYLHYSVIPAYIHLSINSKSIFLSSSWKAKITVFGNAPSLKGSRSLTIPGGWIAPEYLLHGVVNEKVDIFAFGVVLLELISGKEAVDGKLLRESITFNEGGCFDQLRNFVDPCLKDDYPLAEALCLAVLAGSCVQDNPLHRPSMDDVLKILARIV